MLSINKSTFCPSLSLKYSAIVSAVSPTLSLAPGGSFICPYTNAVLSITPLSVISLYKSRPSRVRSPTPANTESPPCPLAILLINSWINTVFPTPAPPNSPIFPPFKYGASKSTTFIPVSSISESVPCCSKDGASLWIDSLNTSASNFSPSSTASPSTLKILPNVALPTGTWIGLPVSITSSPRLNPSVPDIATALTTLFPLWAWTSATNFSPFSLYTSSAL